MSIGSHVASFDSDEGSLNHLTIARSFDSVVLFSVMEQWMLAVVIFIGRITTLDGSLARTRRQITLWGPLPIPWQINC